MNHFLLKIPLISMLCLPLNLHSEESVAVREYQVKAVFLSNFAKFVTWPEATLPTDTTPLSICVLGEDPFSGKLNTILKGSSVKGRSLEVRYYQTVEKTKDCQVVFVSHSEKERLADICSFLKEYPILTVSDIKDFVRNGGMIEFYTLENRVHFFINPQTLKGSGLQVSSRLLQVANIVNGK